MGIKHAKLSASGSARWLNCPASVKLTENIKSTSSIYAQEGTAAHDLAEKTLVARCDPIELKGIELEEGYTATAEMCSYVGEYTDYVMNIVNSGNYALFVEERVDFSPWVPEGFGTSDAIVAGENELHVIDLKYGQGERVYAENNTQGLLYALGAINELDWLYNVDKITIHIIQPRVSNFSEWTITKKELMQFAEYVKRRAELCFEDDAPFGPSDKACRWCPISATCKAHAEHVMQVICNDFDNLDDEIELKDSSVMSNEEIAKLLPYIPMITKWSSALTHHALEEALLGHDIPGFKVVEGRSNRKWADNAEENLIEILPEDALYTKKLNSPTQVTKIIKDNIFDDDQRNGVEELIIKPAGKPTLVPNSDKRKAISSISDEFDEIN